MSSKFVKARACIKCKEYIIIHQEDYRSNVKLKEFEIAHRGHNIIIASINELDGYIYCLKNK